ncbi:MAG: hypothetical protein JW717_02550 [Marinilabiliaceae bacterium]|nr:hypothetical protein [Marinilabiliaceae bacterium]
MKIFVKTLLLIVVLLGILSGCEEYDRYEPIDYSGAIEDERELLKDFYENRYNDGIFDSLLNLCGGDTIDKRNQDTYEGYIIFKTDSVKGPYDTVTSNDIIGYRYNAYLWGNFVVDTIFGDSLTKINNGIIFNKYDPKYDSLVTERKLFLFENNYDKFDPEIWHTNLAVDCVNKAILSTRKYGKCTVFGSSSVTYGDKHDYNSYLFDIEIVYVQQ